MPRRLPERLAPGCIREYRVAARQRYQDGRALADAGRQTAAVYLWGYAAEMVLKAAYFSVIGFAETQPITLADLRAAALTAPGLGVSWPGPNRFHDLRSWAELLVATRSSVLGSAYPLARFGQQVLDTGRRLQLLWCEVIRYHRNVAYAYEVEQVRAGVHWLVLNSVRL